ncbi:sensor histidine kinase [Catenovulum sp. SX2]|uniref:sensor histidine kinase n=1 Tax=Catenovulum sp. SX2 TaxID=3398614 RepID=UPI003F86C50A
MNKAGDLQRQLLISLVFIMLISVFVWSLENYWQNTLQPRLYLVAETQANTLAEAQAATLIEHLAYTQSDRLAAALDDALQVMLIVEDPAIGQRYIHSVELQLDYSVVEVVAGTLDFTMGNNECSECYFISVPLISRQGELFGLANFVVSNGYFVQLSDEMKSKLITEASLTLLLLIIVWLFVSYLVYRLQKAKKIIEASDQAKTRFMANVTHELRTPLNAILGNTQMYKQDEELMLGYGQGINAIDRNAEHLLSMINDILEFSATSESKIVLQPQQVNLFEFCHNLVDMTKINAQLKQLAFNFYLDSDLPKVVLVDEKRLRQVLLNLLANAVKFTSAGCVTFSVNLLSNNFKQIVVRFSVEDTGLGINKSKLKEIFIPFHQLDNSITRAEGTGLGLAISQRLVKLMGTKLEVHSEENVGSRFWFDVTLAPCEVNVSPPNLSTDKVQTAELVLPTQAQILALTQLAKTHNVLAIRAQITQLAAEPQLNDFVQHISPFVKNYRFKQLVEYLQSLTMA